MYTLHSSLYSYIAHHKYTLIDTEERYIHHANISNYTNTPLVASLGINNHKPVTLHQLLELNCQLKISEGLIVYVRCVNDIDFTTHKHMWKFFSSFISVFSSQEMSLLSSDS